MISLAAAAMILSCQMTPTQREVREQLGKTKLVYNVGLPDDIARSIESGENPFVPIALVGEPGPRSGWLTRVSADPAATRIGVTLIQRDAAVGLLAEAGTITRVGSAYSLQSSMKGTCKLMPEKDIK
jgi:hypothetical protein